MRKRGFTIVEVLLTLGIIGVVAALTIPTLSLNYQKKVLGTALATAVSSFETATTTMVVDEAVKDIFATKAWKATAAEDEMFSYSSDSTIKGFTSAFSKYLSFDTTYKSAGEFYEGLEVKNIDGKEKDKWDGFFDENIAMIGKNGAAYFISIPSSKGHLHKTRDEISDAGGNFYKTAANLYIDVNGKAKPNIFGRDIFSFCVDELGNLYSQGSKDFSIFIYGDDSLHWTKTCYTDANGKLNATTGDYCTGRVVENGFKIDY